MGTTTLERLDDMAVAEDRIIWRITGYTGHDRDGLRRQEGVIDVRVFGDAWMAPLRIASVLVWGTPEADRDDMVRKAQALLATDRRPCIERFEVEVVSWPTARGEHYDF